MDSSHAVPGVLLIQLDSSYGSLVNLLRRANLQSAEDLEHFNETVGALDAVLQQTEEALREHLAGDADERDGRDPLQKLRQERAEHAFLSQFIQPPEADGIAMFSSADAPQHQPVQSHPERSKKAQPGALQTAVLNSIIETVTRATNCERGALYLNSSSGLLNVVRAEVGGNSVSHFPMKAGIPQAVFAGCVGLNAFSRSMERLCLKELSAQSVLCLPLHKGSAASKGSARGVLLLTNKIGRNIPFSEQDEGLAAAAALFLHCFLGRCVSDLDVAQMASMLEVVSIEQPQRCDVTNKRLSNQIDASVNALKFQQTVKRVLDDEASQMGHGCIEVQLANLVKEASVASQWMQSEWILHAGQVADSINEGDKLRSEIASLESALRQAHPSAGDSPSAKHDSNSNNNNSSSNIRRATITEQHRPGGKSSSAQNVVPGTLEDVGVSVTRVSDSSPPRRSRLSRSHSHKLVRSQSARPNSASHTECVQVLERLNTSLDRVLSQKPEKVTGKIVKRLVPPAGSPPQSPKLKHNLMFVPKRRAKRSARPHSGRASPPRPESPTACPAAWQAVHPDTDTIPPAPSAAGDLRGWKKPRPPQRDAAPMSPPGSAKKRPRGSPRQQKLPPGTWPLAPPPPPQKSFPTGTVDVAGEFAKTFAPRTVRRMMAA